MIMMPPRVLASGPKPCGGNYYLLNINSIATTLLFSIEGLRNC